MKKTRSGFIRPRSRGFTRSDVLAMLGICGLVFIIVVPGLAQSKARSLQIVCLNNLRQVGRALLVWNSEHDQADLWRTPYWEGGTQVPFTPSPGAPPVPAWASQRNKAWFQYYWLRQELASPSILACPSDKKRPASDFSSSAATGFIHPNFQDNAASYFLSLDSSFSQAGSALAGDRNFITHGSSISCSSGIGTAYSVDSLVGPFGWTNAIHGLTGNVLLHDGRVEPLTTAGLEDAFFPNVQDSGAAHLLVP